MARDWRKLYKQYRGQWVALAEDMMTVVAHGEARNEMRQHAASLGYPDALVLKFPEELVAFAG